MAANDQAENASQSAVVSECNATCCGCSLYCNDIRLEIRGGQIADLQNACEIGNEWFRSPVASEFLVDGEEVSREKAVIAARELISSAKLPLVCGLTDQSTETQRMAIELARNCDAAIDWTSGRAASANLLATQQIGHVSCSFGEIRQRADLVITWFADPMTTHPRFIGRFVDRFIAVDQDQTETVARAEQFFQVEDKYANDVIRLLRYKLSKSHAIQENGQDKLPTESITRLADQIQHSKYCIFVCDDSMANRCGQTSVLSLSKLVRLINDFTHCRVVVLCSQSNSVGVENSMTWITGFPYTVGFRNGQPVFRPDEFTIEHLIANRLADLVICFGDPQQLPDSVVSNPYFGDVSKIIFEDGLSKQPTAANVRFPIAKFGLGQSGTGFRSDGVPVQVAAMLDSGNVQCDELVKQVMESLNQNGRA